MSASLKGVTDLNAHYRQRAEQDPIETALPSRPRLVGNIILTFLVPDPRKVSLESLLCHSEHILKKTTQL